jgi:hypothetical protein
MRFQIGFVKMSEELDEKKKSSADLNTIDMLAGAERNPELLTLFSSNKTTDIDTVSLDKKDYLALSIALIQTIFAPLLVIIVLLIGVSLFFRLLTIIY